MSQFRAALGREIRFPGADALALTALAALVLGLFHEVGGGGRTFYERDIHRYWVQQAEAFVRSVAAGAWPLWNLYISFGEPLLANPTAQVLYPTTWLNLLLRPWTVYTSVVLLHALFAGAGYYALARHLGTSRLAALLSGAVWIASGPFLSLVNMMNQFTGAAWLPWAILAARSAFEGGGVFRAFLLGVTLAAPILAGSPETALIALVTIAVLGAFESPWPVARNDALRRLRLAGLGLLFGLALSAGQWMPTLDSARQSVRGDLPREVRVYHSLPPAGLAQVVAPWFPRGQPLGPDLEELRAPFLYSVHLGLPALALAAGALLPGRWATVGRCLGALALCGLLLSLGRYFWGYDLLVALFPPLKLLRYPVKAMVLTASCVSLMAALGLEAWQERRTCPRWISFAVAALAVGELFAVHRSLNLTAPQELLSVRPRALKSVHQEDGSRLFSRGLSAPAARNVDASRWSAKIKDLGLPAPIAVALTLRSGFVPPIPGEWGFFGSFEPDINGVQPLRLSQLTALLFALEGRPAYLRLLQLGAVSQVVALDAYGLEDLTHVASYETPLGDPILVLRVPAPLPRAYAVGRARVADGAEAFRILLDQGFEGRTEVVLAQERDRGPETGVGFESIVRIVEIEPDRVQLEAAMTGPGYVVLVDTYDPGWKATIDDVETEVLQANTAFRAVRAAAGRHVIVFRYRPASVFLGLAFSGAAAVTGLTLGLNRLAQSTRPRA